MSELLEQLAALEHEQWAYWARVRNPEHPLIDIPYSKLTEEQKEQDRVWARKSLNIIADKVESAYIPVQGQPHRISSVDLYDIAQWLRNFASKKEVVG